MSDSIQLNPAEENELCFEISIEGCTTKESVDKSIVRCHLAESISNGESSLSYTFPASKIQNGSVRVTIPRLSHLIREDKTYTGSLEVIIGGQYFVPQTVDMSFERPLKVEAKNIVVNNKPHNHQPDVLTEKVTAVQPPRVSSKISTPQTKPVEKIKEAPSNKKKLADYTPAQQILIKNELLRMRKLQEQKKQEESMIEMFLNVDELDD